MREILTEKFHTSEGKNILVKLSAKVAHKKESLQFSMVLQTKLYSKKFLRKEFSKFLVNFLLYQTALKEILLVKACPGVSSRHHGNIQ
jgi:hypothetical protein